MVWAQQLRALNAVETRRESEIEVGNGTLVLEWTVVKKALSGLRGGNGKGRGNIST